MYAIITFGRDNPGLGTYTIYTRVVAAEEVEVVYAGADRRPTIKRISGVVSDRLYRTGDAERMLDTLRRSHVDLQVVDLRRHGHDGTPIEMELGRYIQDDCPACGGVVGRCACENQ